MSIALQADSTNPQGYILINGTAAATIRQSGSTSFNSNLSAGGNIVAGTSWNQQTTSYTIQDSDCGGIVALSSTSVTLSAILPSPNNLRSGHQVTIIRLGTGSVVIDANGNSVRHPGNLFTLANQYSVATLVYSGSPDVGWILSGDLA